MLKTISARRLPARYGRGPHLSPHPAAEPRYRRYQPCRGTKSVTVPTLLRYQTCHGTNHTVVATVLRYRPRHRGVRGGVRSSSAAVVRCGRGALKYGAVEAWKKMSQHLREFAAAGPEPATRCAGATGK